MKSALQTLITLRHEFPQTSRPPPVEIEIDFRAQSGRGGGGPTVTVKQAPNSKGRNLTDQNFTFVSFLSK